MQARTSGSQRGASPRSRDAPATARPVAHRAALVIDAGLVAPQLGLSASRFMAELKRGLIYQVAERGVGEHRRRYRVTFRYRARQCRVLIDPDGRAVVAS